MAEPLVNFMSYNSTGSDSVKTSWIRDLLSIMDISFASVQEHFKKIKTVDQYFQNAFPENNCYVIPAYRETGQDKGRPKGGLLQLSRKSLNVKRNLIKTDNFRLQAQTLDFPASRILWINAYFPCDPQSADFDSTELCTLLKEIESIMDENRFDDVIIGADCNWDRSRTSEFSILMEDFVTKIGLKSVWEKFPVNFTHVHTDFVSTSTIDHFLVNERLLEYIEDAGALHLGDNLSRHSPIMIKINLGNIPRKQAQNPAKVERKPAWYKAKPEDITQYTEILHDRLINLPLPPTFSCNNVHCANDHHREDRDDHCIELLCSMIESSHRAIPLSSGRRKPVGSPSKSVGQNIPGWKENVEPFRQDSLSWHAIWLSAGRPPSGELHKVIHVGGNTT